MSTRHNPPADPSGGSAQPDTPRAALNNGRYHLRQKLGQGGMGAVYLADDTLLPGRQVAVKENFNTSSAAQSQFKREALLLARLRHPNLPQVTDFFVTADGKQYLVMDYVPGENLQQILRRRNGPLPPAEALGIIEQVMQALAYMHTWRDPQSGNVRPIIHRDIKPANIKRTPEGHVVLVDFGIAKLDGGTLSNTAASAKALTPGYAPLEQYSGGTDMRSDIYSLGATLYALLTGKAPPTATDMALAGPRQVAPLLGSLKGAPPVAAKVVARAMQSRPADRYQTVAEMHQALFGRPLAASSAAGSSAAPGGGRAARPRWAAWAVGVVILLLAVGIGWLLLRPGDQSTAGNVPTPAALAANVPSEPASEPPAEPPTQAPAEPPTALPSMTPDEPAVVVLSTVTPTPNPAATVEPTAAPDALLGAIPHTPTPTPVAPATAVPTLAVPTRKPTSTPLATATLRPTATPQPTAPPTAPPTATPTPAAAAAAELPPVTATTVALLTEITEIQATRTAIAFSKAEDETDAIADTASATAGGPTSVTILWPPDGTSTNAATEFRWQPNAPLAEGQVFEVVFWQQGQGPDEGRAWTNATSGAQMTINPGDRTGSYRWGVWLGYFDDAGSYHRLRYLGGGNTFEVPGQQGPANEPTSPIGKPSTRNG